VTHDVRETWETKLRRDAAERRAKRAISRDEVVVYDACAHYGKTKSDVPPQVLFDLVYRYIAGEP
jgi:hypothetical protein